MRRIIRTEYVKIAVITNRPSKPGFESQNSSRVSIEEIMIDNATMIVENTATTADLPKMSELAPGDCFVISRGYVNSGIRRLMISSNSFSFITRHSVGVTSLDTALMPTTSVSKYAMPMILAKNGFFIENALTLLISNDER